MSICAGDSNPTDQGMHCGWLGGGCAHNACTTSQWWVVFDQQPPTLYPSQHTLQCISQITHCNTQPGCVQSSIIPIISKHLPCKSHKEQFCGCINVVWKPQKRGMYDASPQGHEESCGSVFLVDFVYSKCSPPQHKLVYPQLVIVLMLPISIHKTSARGVVISDAQSRHVIDNTVLCIIRKWHAKPPLEALLIQKRQHGFHLLPCKMHTLGCQPGLHIRHGTTKNL